MNPVTAYDLPWPPSVNHYYRSTERHGQRVRTKAARAYRDAVWLAVKQQGGHPFGKARLKLELKVHPPDRRARDLDNLLKGIQDALTAAGVYDDDRQIDRLGIERYPVTPKGRIIVHLSEYAPEVTITEAPA